MLVYWRVWGVIKKCRVRHEKSSVNHQKLRNCQEPCGFQQHMLSSHFRTRTCHVHIQHGGGYASAISKWFTLTKIVVCNWESPIAGHFFHREYFGFDGILLGKSSVNTEQSMFDYRKVAKIPNRDDACESRRCAIGSSLLVITNQRWILLESYCISNILIWSIYIYIHTYLCTYI